MVASDTSSSFSWSQPKSFLLSTLSAFRSIDRHIAGDKSEMKERWFGAMCEILKSRQRRELPRFAAVLIGFQFVLELRYRRSVGGRCNRPLFQSPGCDTRPMNRKISQLFNCCPMCALRIPICDAPSNYSNLLNCPFYAILFILCSFCLRRLATAAVPLRTRGGAISFLFVND